VSTVSTVRGPDIYNQFPIYEKTDKSCTSSELPVFPLVSKSLEPAEGGKGGAGEEGAGKAALIIFHHIVLTQASTAKRKTLTYVI
jgi:hypothetical protein